jgi:Ca-activated chloride channel homolog
VNVADQRRPPFALLALLLSAFAPFQAEERNVREGNERLASGDAAGALARYQAAEERAGARSEIDYDRGDALYRLGRGGEAVLAWRKAREKAPAALGSRASQNEGTALAASGDRDGAVAALTEALRLDPANEDARFDLEVLLRRKQAEDEERRKADRGAQPRPSQAGGGPGQEDARGPDEPQAGKDPRDGAQAKAPPPAPQGNGPGDRDQGAAGQAGGDAEGMVSLGEAERILDAFRARERALPREVDRRRARRADGDRDW